MQKGFEVTPLNHLKPSNSTLERIGITMNQWSKILDGEKELTLSQAKQLAEWLNIPITDLIS